MQDLHLAEPALLTAHDGLSVALALLGDYDYLDPTVTAAELASLTVRLQMIASRLTSLADELARLQRRAIQDDATGTGPSIADLVAANTAKEYLTDAHDRLRMVPDHYGSARKYLRLADQLPSRQPDGGEDA